MPYVEIRELLKHLDFPSEVEKLVIQKKFDIESYVTDLIEKNYKLELNELVPKLTKLILGEYKEIPVFPLSNLDLYSIWLKEDQYKLEKYY